MKAITIRSLLNVSRKANIDPAAAVKIANKNEWIYSRNFKKISYFDGKIEIGFSSLAGVGYLYRPRHDMEPIFSEGIQQHMENAIENGDFKIEYSYGLRKKLLTTIVANGNSCSIQSKIGNKIIQASGIPNNKNLCVSAILCIGYIDQWTSVINGINWR